jgi:hypothetical protein
MDHISAIQNAGVLIVRAGVPSEVCVPVPKVTIHLPNQSLTNYFPVLPRKL